MQIANRLRKLERQRLPKFTEEAPECSHPRSKFRLRRDYPSVGTSSMYKRFERGLVIKGHCDSCGYDAPLWDITNTEPDQIEKLINNPAGDGRCENAYSLWLIENGFLDYTPWPPTPMMLENGADYTGESV